MANSIYDFNVTRLDGTEAAMADYQDKVLLIVNTASRCGFTPQYQSLQSLYQRYNNQGFEVLGFPCNQFGMQEPGNADEIAEFCTLNYQVTFPMFAKVAVNGKDAHPLFTYLKAQAKGILGSSDIKWNFTKFLVDRQGQVVGRYGSITAPKELVATIEGLL
jgi:glutathione peroxidase